MGAACIGQSRYLLAATVSAFQLDSTTNTAIAAVFRATSREAKVPATIHWYATRTGAPGTLRVGIETLSSGQPSGSLYDANATVDVAPAATGPDSGTFAVAPAALSAGTAYAVVLNPTSGTWDGSNNIAVRTQSLSTVQAWTRKGTTKAAGSWAAANAGPGTQVWIMIEFTDGTVAWVGGVPTQSTWTGMTTEAITSSAFAGFRFTAPATGPLVAAHIACRRASGASGDLEFVLREVGGGSDLATSTISYASIANTGNAAIGFVEFATPYTVSRGTEYILYMRASSATPTYSMYYGPSLMPISPDETFDGMQFVTGATEPPNTDAVGTVVGGYWIEPSAGGGGGGGGGPLIGPGRLIR